MATVCGYVPPQDGEVLDQPASDSDMSEPDQALCRKTSQMVQRGCCQVPNGNSEPRGMCMCRESCAASVFQAAGNSGIHSAEGLCEEEDRKAESEEQNPLNTQAAAKTCLFHVTLHALT